MTQPPVLQFGVLIVAITLAVTISGLDIVCPACVPDAGCRQFGCDCTAPDGTPMSPPSNSPQTNRPDGCPICEQFCPRDGRRCQSPNTTCTCDQLDTYVPICPDCVPFAGCPEIGCTCTDCNGTPLTPPTNPPQPPRPKGCPVCSKICPMAKIKCPDPALNACSDDQLDRYVPLMCPECVFQAGCKQIGCNCRDSRGYLWTTKTNPPQPERPFGCHDCPKNCIQARFRCPEPQNCTRDQLKRYVPDCPECVALAGCKEIGCDCLGRKGILLTPPTSPPQPFRPPICPACPDDCLKSNIRCRAPTKCTSKQLQRYVPQCPDCVDQAGCQQSGCDCTDDLGNLLTPPVNPPQPRRPYGCPACSTVCVKTLILCAQPTQCTEKQLDTYELKCPACVPQAGCQQLGCECYDSRGNPFIPATNPPQPIRPVWCPKCPKNCIIPFVPCGKPNLCTREELRRFIPKPNDDEDYCTQIEAPPSARSYQIEEQ